VQAVAFSPNGDTVATGDTDGLAYLWDAATGTRTAALADSGGEGVEALVFSPNGDRLAVGDADGSTYLWDPVNRAVAATLHVRQETHGVSSVAFSPKGTILATGNHAGSTFLWRLAGARSRN
jgi:WD40 repeat protein